MADDAAPARPASCTELFLAFSALALQGFGGVLAVAQRVLCEERRWLTKAEFLELLAIGQVLPGPNVCNLSLMVGDRYFGTRGAFAALAGMIAAPLAIALAAMALYAQFADHPVVAGALRGMGAVAAGLVLGTAIKLALPLRTSPLGLPLVVALGAACFAAVAWARLPLAAVLLGLGPLACALAWWRLPREAA
jgi:chromate transporter